MEDLDIIEERDGMRVRLQRDEGAEKPYDDGACPILTVETNRYGGYIVGAFNRQADDYVVDAAEILGRHGMETLERFVKIFRGAARMETYWSNGLEGNYVAFDTAAWREKVGAAEEGLAKEDYLSEVRAWAEGDVWGYIVEKEVFWTKIYTDANGEPLHPESTLPDLDADSETGSDWIEVDSCWGLYGRDYAEESAKGALSLQVMP